MFVNNWLLHSKCLLIMDIIISSSTYILGSIMLYVFLFSRFIMLKGVGKVIKTKGTQTKTILVKHTVKN